MATRIRNKNAESASLPFPFREVLPPGGAVIVAGTPEEVLEAFVNPQAAAVMFAFDTVPDNQLPAAPSAGAAWDDIRVPLTSAKAPASGLPSFGNIGIGSLQGWLFAAAFEQSLGFNAQIPHSYIEGTALLPHIHWKTTDGGGGTVRWLLEYIIASPFGSYPGASASLIVDVDVTSDPGAAIHRFDSFPEIPGTGLLLSAQLIGRIARVGTADTYAAEAHGIEVDFHFQKRRFGSEVPLPV